MLTVSSVGKNGRRASALRSTPTKPNDVVTFTVPKTGTASTFTQLTAVNDDVLAGQGARADRGDLVHVEGRSQDPGLDREAAGLRPDEEVSADARDPRRPAVDVQRRRSTSRARITRRTATCMLYTNPRGSTGYGEKFTNEIKNAYPGKDFDDLMAGVDTVIGRGYVDTKNMFVYGCSGGGVLTAWTVGHTDRFAAAASLCPVINWMSFVGETDGAGWYQNFEKPFWEDPSEYLKRSPIMYVGNVKTPTMLMTGVLDLRTPMPQSEEFYRALKMRGVPTALVRMNNEFHGTSSTPSNFLRTQLYHAKLVRQVWNDGKDIGHDHIRAVSRND